MGGRLFPALMSSFVADWAQSTNSRTKKTNKQKTTHTHKMRLAFDWAMTVASNIKCCVSWMVNRTCDLITRISPRYDMSRLTGCWLSASQYKPLLWKGRMLARNSRRKDSAWALLPRAYLFLKGDSPCSYLAIACLPVAEGCPTSRRMSQDKKSCSWSAVTGLSVPNIAKDV